MTSWQDIQKEILKYKSPEKPNGDFDFVRREKYNLVRKLTGHPLLIYASAFHNPIKAQIASQLLSIDLSDKDGFYEIIRNIDTPEVDIFLHSPGGSAEATESIVKLLRSKFKIIRFIITGSAKLKARIISNFLTNEKKTLSHARRIDINQLKKLQIKVIDLDEQNKELQDAIRQLHLSIMMTLEGTGAVKIFENSEGSALIRIVNIGPVRPV